MDNWRTTGSSSGQEPMGKTCQDHVFFAPPILNFPMVWG